MRATWSTISWHCWAYLLCVRCALELVRIITLAHNAKNRHPHTSRSYKHTQCSPECIKHTHKKKRTTHTGVFFTHPTVWGYHTMKTYTPHTHTHVLTHTTHTYAHTHTHTHTHTYTQTVTQMYVQILKLDFSLRKTYLYKAPKRFSNSLFHIIVSSKMLSFLHVSQLDVNIVNYVCLYYT